VTNLSQPGSTCAPAVERVQWFFHEPMWLQIRNLTVRINCVTTAQVHVLQNVAAMA